MSPDPLPLDYQFLMSGEKAVCLLRQCRIFERDAARVLYDSILNAEPIPPEYWGMVEMVFLLQTQAWTPSVH